MRRTNPSPYPSFKRYLKNKITLNRGNTDNLKQLNFILQLLGEQSREKIQNGKKQHFPRIRKNRQHTFPAVQ
jgi:hypothetical protein